MQISIMPTGASSYTPAVQLLGTDPDEDMQDFQFGSQSQIQEVAGLGAGDIALFPRGNKKVSFTFMVQREHDDADAAAYFVPSYEAQFPVQGLLTYQTDAGVLYQLGAVAEVTRATFLGATSTISYRVTGGGFVTTMPTG